MAVGRHVGATSAPFHLVQQRSATSKTIARDAQPLIGKNLIFDVGFSFVTSLASLIPRSLLIATPFFLIFFYYCWNIEPSTVAAVASFPPSRQLQPTTLVVLKFPITTANS